MCAQNKPKAMDAEKAHEVREALAVMEKDLTYQTDSGYSSNESLYPDNNVPFIEKHMNYLAEHKNVNPEQYLSNLRLMTRIRNKV
jgi:hypothetical protein